MTHDIRVGDTVRLTGEDWRTCYGLPIGTKVEVDRVDSAGQTWAGEAGVVGNRNGLFSSDNPEPSGDFSVELVGRGIKSTNALLDTAARVEKALNPVEASSYAKTQLRNNLKSRTEISTPVDPNHYKFPGGAEVIDISQWLTANAAQAVQYICRSSRIDGKNKGDAVEDIEKAIRFLTFEKERLRDANN